MRILRWKWDFSPFGEVRRRVFMPSTWTVTKKSGPSFHPGREARVRASSISAIGRTVAVAARQLRREPAATMLIAVTMAIGIAAAAAIFTVGRAVVLRPLPYRNPQSLVALQEYQPERRRDQTSVAFANLERYRAARSFSGLTAFGYSEFVLSGSMDAERVLGATVDAQLLETLGVTPFRGRGVSADEEAAGARVVLLSSSLWRRRYGADPRILERSIEVDGDRYTVVGVMPESFEFPRNPSMGRDVELWVPRRPLPPMMARRGVRSLSVVARLAPGVRLSEAQAEANAITTRAGSDDAPVNAGWSGRVLDLRDAVVGTVRPNLLVLAGCVAVLLLIACVNASAAVLARVTMRRQAFGVQLALGASRRRVVGSVLAETTLLAALSAAAALPLSAFIRGMLVHLAPVALPRQQGIALDGPTLLFTLAVAVSTACCAAFAPIAWLHQVDAGDFLKEASRTAAGSRRRNRLLGTFVVVQLALCTVLFAITAEFYGGFVQRNRVDPGFDPSHVTSATIALPGMRYRDLAARALLTGQLVERVAAIPGVVRAAVGSLLPLSGGLMSASYQVPAITADSTGVAALRAVSAGFLETLGVPLRSGRMIGADDRASSPRVAVVNEALVRQSFGGRPALGATIRFSPPGADQPQDFEIAGVVADAKETDLLGPATPIVYFSDQQASLPHTVLVFRTTGTAPVAAVRTALRELDPALALDDVNSLAARVRSTYSLQIFLLNVIGAFAVAAAVLVGVGVYGSMSYVLAAELRGLGVRIALGASPRRILGAVIARVGLLAVIGGAIGLAVSIVTSRALIPPGMGSTGGAFVAGALAVTFLALGAAWLPAWRASRSDPLIALRAQ